MPATRNDDATNGHSVGRDPGYMRCEMVLCIDTGPAYELKWCPLPSNDPLQVGYHNLTNDSTADIG